VLLDVAGQQLDQLQRQVDGALAAVLRCPDLHRGTAGPLHLPPDVERTAQEVDVSDLHRGGPAQPQPGERGERDQRPEPDVHSCQYGRGDLLAERAGVIFAFHAEDARDGRWQRKALEAALCIAAGADLTRLTEWIAEGQERAERIR
jgi:hypothetical protein